MEVEGEAEGQGEGNRENEEGDRGGLFCIALGWVGLGCFGEWMEEARKKRGREEGRSVLGGRDGWSISGVSQHTCHC